MFVRYYKGTPNAYVIAYRGGRVVHEGAGLSFFYTPFNTALVVVPVCLLYTSPSPRDGLLSRMPSSA